MANVTVDVTDELSRSQAAQACGVSVDTIKRRLKVNAFPHARQLGLDRQWAIPVRDLIDAGLLPAAALASASPPDDAPDIIATRPLIAPGQSAQIVEALAENRGLRAELARAQDEIAFLRGLIQSGRAA